MSFEHLWEDVGFQRVKHSWVAEEAGDVDQHVLIKSLYFGGVRLGIPYVVVELLDFVNHHPAVNAAEDGRLAVVREVDSGGPSQYLKDRGQSGIISNRQVAGIG